jgi:hypothetical protein
MARSSVVVVTSFWLVHASLLINTKTKSERSPHARRCVADVEVGVDALVSLPAQLTRAFAARGGFPGDGGSKKPHLMVLLRELGFKLAHLSQLRVDIGPPRQ